MPLVFAMDYHSYMAVAMVVNLCIYLCVKTFVKMVVMDTLTAATIIITDTLLTVIMVDFIDISHCSRLLLW